MFEYSTAITENQQPFDKDLHSVGQLILFQLSTNYDNTYACVFIPPKRVFASPMVDRRNYMYKLVWKYLRVGPWSLRLCKTSHRFLINENGQKM